MILIIHHPVHPLMATEKRCSAGPSLPIPGVAALVKEAFLISPLDYSSSLLIVSIFITNVHISSLSLQNCLPKTPYLTMSLFEGTLWPTGSKVST